MGGGTSHDKAEAADDPSMEDILASIRRILNDDSPADQPAATPADHVAAPPTSSSEDVFVLDHSMLIEEPAKMVPEAALQAAPGTAPGIVPGMTPQLAPAVVPQTASVIVPDVTSEVAPKPVPQHASSPSRPAPDTLAHEAFAPAVPPPTDADSEPLLAPAAAAAANASMGALVRVLGQQQTQVYRGGPTLEEMVRDEIRPMMKSWLDENLAPMVERMVRAEIARVTNGK